MHIRSVFSKRVKQHFTEGDCWALALELREYGYSCVTLMGYNEETKSYVHLHGLVQLSEDLFVDVTGVYSRDTLLRHWSTYFAKYSIPVSKLSISKPWSSRDCDLFASRNLLNTTEDKVKQIARRLDCWLVEENLAPTFA